MLRILHSFLPGKIIVIPTATDFHKLTKRYRSVVTRSLKELQNQMTSFIDGSKTGLYIHSLSFYLNHWEKRSFFSSRLEIRLDIIMLQKISSRMKRFLVTMKHISFQFLL